MLLRKHLSVKTGRLFSSKYLIAVESSCDDTCLAKVMKDSLDYTEWKVSYGSINRSFGGVFPYIISSCHEITLIDHLFKHKKDILNAETITCTVGPGIHACLSRGLTFAKLLSNFLDVKLAGGHHMEGHIFSGEPSKYEYPFLSLLISGGHTLITLTERVGHHIVLSSSVDDNIGETFDKIARELPSTLCHGSKTGMVIEKIVAAGISTDDVDLNYSSDSLAFDFSFSGLKTAALSALRSSSTEQSIVNTLHSFHKAVEICLTKKLEKCLQLCNESGFFVNQIVIGGGVSSNTILKNAVSKFAIIHGLECIFPRKGMSTDNAAMIGVSSVLRERMNMTINIRHALPEFPLGYLKDDDAYLSQYM